MISGAPELHAAHAAIIAEDSSGAALYEHNADDVTPPASTIKLLTGSAALERLGPAFRFRTVAGFVPYMIYGGPRIPRLPGFLVLRAGGDPLLRSSDLDSLVALLHQRFPVIRSSALSIDALHFEPATYGSGWSWDDFPYAYAPVLSAASLDENVIRLRITPGAAAGSPATVTTEGSALTGVHQQCEGGCGPSLHFDLIADVTTGQRGSEPSVDMYRDANGSTRVVGSIAVDAAPASLKATVPSAEVYLADTLVAKLTRPGVMAEINQVNGVSSRGRQFDPFWTHDSEPLSDMLADLWWPSDNLVAELLLKEIGVAENGEPGTTEHGLAYERAWLKNLGIDPASVSLDDGSGVSPYNRVSPRVLATVLLHDWNGPYRNMILDDLPIAGVRGTTQNDFKGTSSEGRLFVKTGSLTHVSGFAGYAATKCHGTVIFAFQVDDWLGDIDALNGLRARFFDRIINAPC